MPHECVPSFLLLRSPAVSLGFIILGDSFAYVTVFNPTIEVVTFCLRGYMSVSLKTKLSIPHS